MNNNSQDNAKGIQSPGNAIIDSFIDSLPIAVYACNADGRITYYNKAAEILWGRVPVIEEDNWSGAWKTFALTGEQLTADQQPMAVAWQKKLFNQDGEEEIIVERPDGTRSNILAHSMPFYDAESRLTSVLTVLTDVTEQRKAEVRQAILAAIVESSDDAIISKTLNGVITSWNQAAERIFGFRESEMIGKPVMTIIPENYWNEESMILNKIRNNERVEHYETWRLTKSGSLIPVSLTISPIKNKHGVIVGASKIARNIARQKEVEKNLQHNAENLETLNSLGKAISKTLDPHEILQNVTDGTTQLTGADFGAFFYNTINDKNEEYMLYTLSGAPREDFEKLGMPRNTAVFKTTFNGEGIVRVDDITKDERYGLSAPHYGMPKGHLPVVSYLAVPVISKAGTVMGGLFFGHREAGQFTKEHEDLVSAVAVQAATALDNAQLYEEVRKLNDKKDEFISLASHELKTPITSLNGFLQLIDESLEQVDANKAFIKIALKQIRKLSDLVSDLLDVSKLEAGKLPLSFSVFNLVQLTGEIINQFQYSAKDHTIELSYEKNSILVNADKQRIEQVIINLLSNATKYSPNANMVKVHVACNHTMAVVSVEDFGIGITNEQQAHIFSRFYRVEDIATKPGLGIGLYICKEIISRHNGRLWVKSTPSHGSVFGFELPLSSAGY